MSGLKVTTSDGKYTVVQEESGGMSFLRHGEPWPEANDAFAHVGMILALAQDIEALRELTVGTDAMPKRPGDKVKARVRAWVVITPDNEIKAVAGKPDAAMQVMRTLAFPGRNALDPAAVLNWTMEARELGWRCAPALVKELDQ